MADILQTGPMAPSNAVVVVVVEADLVPEVDGVVQLLAKVALDEVVVLDLAVVGLRANLASRKQNGPNESKRNSLEKRWHLYWPSHRRIQVSMSGLGVGICDDNKRAV